MHVFDSEALALEHLKTFVTAGLDGVFWVVCECDFGLACSALSASVLVATCR